MLLLVGGCVGSPVIFAPDSPCSALVPQDWRGGVKSTPLPDTPPEGLDPLDEAVFIAKAWQSFGIDQTAKLLGVNDRFDAAMGIVERCEARDAQAIKRAKPKFLGIF